MPYLDAETADKLNSINLVDFLEAHGYDLKKTGPNSYNLIIDGEVSSLAVFLATKPMPGVGNAIQKMLAAAP